MKTSDATDFAEGDGTAIDFSSATDSKITLRDSSNAQIKVNDGVVENSTNDFTSNIPGLTINAIAANAGTTDDVTVALDTSAIQEKSRLLLLTQ